MNQGIWEFLDYSSDFFVSLKLYKNKNVHKRYNFKYFN